MVTKCLKDSNYSIFIPITLLVRISFSVGAPSLLRKFDGIRPAAAYFCLQSTVNGINEEDTPGFNLLTDVTKTEVSPRVATVAPSASFAIFPLSKISFLLFSLQIIKKENQIQTRMSISNKIPFKIYHHYKLVLFNILQGISSFSLNQIQYKIVNNFLYQSEWVLGLLSNNLPGIFYFQ